MSGSSESAAVRRDEIKQGETVGFTLTLLSLIAFLVADSFLETVYIHEGESGNGLIVMFLLALVVSLGSLVGTRRALMIGGILALGPVVLVVVMKATRNPTAAGLTLFSLATYFGYVALAILRKLNELDEIDGHAISGVVASYMLSGFAFAAVYTGLGVLVPDPAPFDPPSLVNHLWADSLHFSFATLTTVGWGDISAFAPMARAVATLESVYGVMFMALVVARFASAFWERRRNPG